MELSKAQGYFNTKVYIGDLFVEKAKVRELKDDELEKHLEDIIKDEWVEMREPTQTERKILMKHTNINEKFFEGKSAKELQTLSEANSKGTVSMIDSLNELMGTCLLDSTITENGAPLSHSELSKFVMASGGVYERCLDTFTGAMALKKKKEKK